MKNEYMQSIKSSLAQIELSEERKEALYWAILERGSHEKGEIFMNRNLSRGMRATLIVAIVLVLSFTLVACIPAARAEVLSWFGVITEPREFLTADPETRNNEEVETLVIKAEENQQVTILNRGEYGEVSKSICAAFENGNSAELLETLYDGTNLYVSVKFPADSGLWLLEQYTGGTKTRSAIPIDKLDGYFGGNEVPEEFKSGDLTMYEFVEGWLQLKFNDAAVRGGMFDLYLSDNYPYVDETTDWSEIDKINEEWMKTHDIIGVVQIGDVSPEFLKELADENGIVTADVNLNMEIMLDGDAGDNTKVFEAELGSVKIDALAHERMAVTVATAGDTVSWMGDAMLTVHDWSGETIKIQNIDVKLDGLSMRPIDLSVSALGVKDVRFEIIFPTEWSKEQCDAFMSCVDYEVLINGEKDEDIYFGRKTTSDGAVENRLEMVIDELGGIALDRIDSIETITLVPYLSHETTVTLISVEGNDVPHQTWDLTKGEIAELPGNCSWNGEPENTVYEDCALFFKVK